MKVLIITGDLAYPLIKSVVEDANEDVIVHVADTQVAAFLTPNMIIKEVKTYFFTLEVRKTENKQLIN